ncbi:hypothetical protein J5N97_003545 [Dioscorea zingiberensis]|uniref:DUF295 domain-containing protein n=1 Tax=Dioscorea zingiberensis TaxID=325984 RepID=A0A9D5HQG8_9LILI|nr:hypothetical protein J5N97_003545 [Dioscorea zingiberensis]
MAEWLELPRDLLGLIAQKILLVTDFQSFAAVCHDWRSVAMENWHRRHLQIPLLMHSFAAPTNTCNFISIPGDNPRFLENFPPLKVQVHYFCSSSQECLVTMDKNLDIYLVSPMTGAHIKLPRHQTHVDSGIDYNYYLSKAKLSGSPTSSDCVIVAVFRERTLSSLRLGEESWTYIPGARYHPDVIDIIYHNDNVYAVRNISSSTVVTKFGVDKSKWVISSNSDRVVKPYLVHSVHGDLFCVIRYYHPLMSAAPAHHPNMFEVFCLNEISQKWIRVDDFLDQAVFLDSKQAVCIPASDSIQGNSIYFLDPSDHHLDWIHVCKVFNIQKKEVEVLNKFHSSFRSPPIIITIPSWSCNPPPHLRYNDPEIRLHHRPPPPSLRRRCRCGRWIGPLGHWFPPESKNTQARSPHRPNQRLLKAPPPPPPLPRRPLLVPALRCRRTRPRGNPDTPSETLTAALSIGDGVPISLIRQPDRSLNARFLPRTTIRTRSVVVYDDEVNPDPHDLALAFSQWLGRDRALVGFFDRSHALDLEAKTWIYTLHHDRYSIMLTKLMILKTEYLYRYSCWNSLREARGLVEGEGNCEDILMNFVAAMEKGGGEGPVLVEGRVRDWSDPRNNRTSSLISGSDEEEIRRVGLSSPLDHRKRRGWCIRELHRILGVMPLRYSYGKVVEGVGEHGLCNKGGNLVYCDNQWY